HNKSNHNSSVFITAPGASVRTTTNSSGYSNSTGTSFSAPFAAAAAAVLLSIDGGLTEDEVMDTLASTAQDKGDPGLDEYYGYGIVDIGAAVAELAGSSYEPPEGDFEILEAGGSPAAVKNNTNEALQYINILADYDQDGRFVDLFFSTVSVPAKRAVSIEPFEGGGLRERFCVTADLFTPLF
ncbi:MAG: S8 family serine peptidase, partial [Firmicutes bacterium]|nr:S8 family serine peptidase [Bacillota bacterium]